MNSISCALYLQNHNSDSNSKNAEHPNHKRNVISPENNIHWTLFNLRKIKLINSSNINLYVLVFDSQLLSSLLWFCLIACFVSLFYFFVGYICLFDLNLLVSLLLSSLLCRLLLLHLFDRLRTSSWRLCLLLMDRVIAKTTGYIMIDIYLFQSLALDQKTLKKVTSSSSSISTLDSALMGDMQKVMVVMMTKSDTTLSRIVSNFILKSKKIRSWSKGSHPHSNKSIFLCNTTHINDIEKASNLDWMVFMPSLVWMALTAIFSCLRWIKSFHNSLSINLRWQCALDWGRSTKSWIVLGGKYLVGGWVDHWVVWWLRWGESLHATSLHRKTTSIWNHALPFLAFLPTLPQCNKTCCGTLSPLNFLGQLANPIHNMLNCVFPWEKSLQNLFS